MAAEKEKLDLENKGLEKSKEKMEKMKEDLEKVKQEKLEISMEKRRLETEVSGWMNILIQSDSRNSLYRHLAIRMSFWFRICYFYVCCEMVCSMGKFSCCIRFFKLFLLCC